MSGQNPLKNIWLRLKNVHDALLQVRIFFQQKKQAGHESGASPKSRVSNAIAFEISAGNRISQSVCLLKCKTKTFAGDGVHSSGRVAD